MKIRFLVPHRVASELLEQTPTLVTNLQSFDVLHVGFRVLQNTPSAFYGGIQTSCIDCLAFPCPKPVTVMDPGEGPRGTRPPLIFRPNWGSTGGKKFFGDRTSPPPLLISGCGLPPPPPLPYLKVWIRHCCNEEHTSILNVPLDTKSKLWFFVSLPEPCRTPWKGWKTADWRKR